MSITLAKLLAGIPGVTATGAEAKIRISGMCLDSRQLQPGDLFVALRGSHDDGHHHIGAALEAGAAAVLFEDPQWPGGNSPVPQWCVPQLRERLGTLANRVFDRPSHDLQVIGVTGTNGKTTCVHLLAQALVACGQSCALMGTVGEGFISALRPSRNTTPDVISVHRTLAAFREQGAQVVCMEVSSHGLQQGRVDGVRFSAVVFTNLSHEHLDYHGSMRNYGEAKARLFGLPGVAHRVINADDPFGQELLARYPQSISYGFCESDVRALGVRPSPDGLSLKIRAVGDEFPLVSSLLGQFNAGNLLASLATLLCLGLSPSEAVLGLEGARAVPGRMEPFGGGAGRPRVVVDYAHTPAALEAVLRALRDHVSGRIVCVFGCGGDRDAEKRPIMGQIAERLADQVILTDDNPRHESPEEIVSQIRRGMHSEPAVVHDRRAAILQALDSARPRDVVLVAGKGHEDTQQVGDVRIPFSDRTVVNELLGKAA
ncbi:MAG: UDP-N-acetylmuramoyl-L-alanyl-D-glutamate--2,6-diaminopimelate ligase [Gammaproteobacteria bacterium]|nr:UDP-N-acetylmuramoyl-L-alanyl-D-glutamate--2,6-diaminopimelate ligase [Gammaproteobacteria bacterium]